MTPLSPASAVIMLLLEVASIEGMVSEMQMTRTMFFSWNAKVERVLRLLSNAGV